MAPMPSASSTSGLICADLPPCPPCPVQAEGGPSQGVQARAWSAAVTRLYRDVHAPPEAEEEEEEEEEEAEGEAGAEPKKEEGEREREGEREGERAAEGGEAARSEAMQVEGL
jgi:hypothetical protein